MRIYTKAAAHTYLESVPNIDGIIVYFNKTPQSIVCPHFWELRWAFGCDFNCDYCYLQGTGRGDKHFRKRPIDKVLQAIDKAFRHEYFLKNSSIFNSGELTDSLMRPNLMERIAEKFEEQGRHKLLLLTKSDNFRILDRSNPFEQTIVSFSINAPEVWGRWEHKTVPPEKRIEAAKMISDIGYETRIRIDPIFPIENWHREYSELLHLLLSKFTPERITLGTPRGLAKTLMFSEDRSWAQYFTEDSAWGKKIPSILREEIYLFIYQTLDSLGFDKSKVSICKETRAMWEQLGLDYANCRCNCVW